MQHILVSLVRPALASLCVSAMLIPAAAADNPFVGHWALTIPGGGAGWLGVTQEKGYCDASVLWGGGSVVPVDSVFFDDEKQTLFVTRITEVKRKDASGKVVRTHRFPEVIMARLEGDRLDLTQLRPGDHGIAQHDFTGKRIPPLPAAPDLARVRFGDPAVLFDGKSLAGWQLTHPNQVNGWSVQEGVLINRPDQQTGRPHRSYGNLRTEREFEDFRLTLETRVPKGGNSGVYLRGIYEVQVADSHGRAPNSHGMGGVYSRITPTENAAKPAGEWQALDITLVDRHVTVVLNGKIIIDNQPLLGCTGGALWSDQFRPGPLYLQGDHTAVDYRNIVLRPVLH
ncbi:MAG: DUF1080 domain-containing protein [Verrucomicrobia bacterium]|nr:DUF1080 domain-containing protein [Verrucomicrobiota bacterium]